MARIGAETINQLATLEPGWDGNSAKPPTEPALTVLRGIAIVPTVDGGIQIEWHCMGYDVEIEIDADGVPDAWWMKA